MSLGALLLSNAVPLFGVLALGWDLPLLLLLFWFESAVIGAFNVLKMIVVGGGPRAFFLIPFFCIHYGFFMFGHLVFLVVLFTLSDLRDAGGANLLRVMGSLSGAWSAIAMMVLSHGVSFGYHFLGRGEFRRTNISRLFTAPYARIVVMHLTIVFGALPVIFLQSRMPALLLLVALKTGVDLWAHLREHKRLDAPTEPTAAPVDEATTERGVEGR